MITEKYAAYSEIEFLEKKPHWTHESHPTACEWTSYSERMDCFKKCRFFKITSLPELLKISLTRQKVYFLQPQTSVLNNWENLNEGQSFVSKTEHV